MVPAYMYRQLPETSQEVDKEMEHVVFRMEQLGSNQSFQVEISGKEMAVIKHRRERGCWLSYKRCY